MLRPARAEFSPKTPVLFFRAASVYEWDGNKKHRQGRMEIVDSSPPSRVLIQLGLRPAPFEAHNLVEFTLESNGDSTNVTWAMARAQSYLARLIGIFLSMDSMIGQRFRGRLAALKTVAER